MDELEKLKKDWKRAENSFTQLTEKDIYAMLHRKSSSIVKWILIISVLEVLLWTFIGLFYSADDFLQSLQLTVLLMYFRILNYINYAVILLFIFLFYRNYINISSTSSVGKLMDDILKTRKTVQYYVWYNLLMIVIGLGAGFLLNIFYNPDIHLVREQMTDNGGYMFLILAILALTILLAVGIFWVFYRLLYGILLRRLQSNYKELKKIEN